MSDEQKRDISNGAWLCRRCAAVVDIECEKYPVGTISRMQMEAANDRYYDVVGRHKEDGNDT